MLKEVGETKGKIRDVRDGITAGINNLTQIIKRENERSLGRLKRTEDTLKTMWDDQFNLATVLRGITEDTRLMRDDFQRGLGNVERRPASTPRGVTPERPIPNLSPEASPRANRSARRGPTRDSSQDYADPKLHSRLPLPVCPLSNQRSNERPPRRSGTERNSEDSERSRKSLTYQLPKLPHYEGVDEDGHIDNWLSSVEEAADASGWSDRELCHVVEALVSMRILEHLNIHPRQEREFYEQIRQILLKRYGSRRTAQSVRDQFPHSKQETNETSEDFLDRLLRD